MGSAKAVVVMKIVTYILVPKLVNLVVVGHAPLHDVDTVPIARLHLGQTLAGGTGAHFLHGADTFLRRLHLECKHGHNTIATTSDIENDNNEANEIINKAISSIKGGRAKAVNVVGNDVLFSHYSKILK